MDETKELVVREANPPQPNGKPPQAVAIASMLELAIDKGLSVEGLEKIVGLYERMADRQAGQDFADALMAFQGECPPIAKTSKAQITTRGGSSYTYRFADLAEIARTVGPLLHKYGLSYTWDSKNVEGKALEVTCWLRHRNGHREPATFQVPIDNPSAMNDQQKHAAALTYARRQSLIAALGLTTAEPDTDGNDPHAKVSEEQAHRLEELFDGLKLSRARFFRTLALPEDSALGDIPAALFPTAQNLLLMKRQADLKAEGPAQ